MLIVIFGVFAILWMPYRVMVVYNSFASTKYKDPWFLLFCRIMVYINSAINPILYNAMSVKFRRAFQNILCCGVGKLKHGSDAYSEYTMDQRAAIRLNNCPGMEKSYLLMPPNSKRKNPSMESITLTESDGGRPTN
ncbi:thyrotropin-releasing hormone receptor-like [Saccostrea cucullata]|uniref:thyrotropin-releasing hormone receptor-like n=1 Tax=Saccostrea cuccullata TaxID=36930 RepID=UPI002ED26540